MENRCHPRHHADRCTGSPTAWGSRISPSSMPTVVVLAARCGFPLSPQLHRGIPACGACVARSRGTLWYGLNARSILAEPEVRIRSPPEESRANHRFLSGGAPVDHFWGRDANRGARVVADIEASGGAADFF